MRKVIVHWQPSSFFGWGVYGLNLLLAWSGDPDILPVGSVPIHRDNIIVDALRWQRLRRYLRASREFQEGLKAFENGPAAARWPMLAAFGADFLLGKACHGVMLSGTPTIAVAFFETTQLTPEAIERARQFPLVVAGSKWNEQVLRAHGLEHVRTVIQGIDPSLFHPAPRLGLFRDRFLVFSGGKLEHRKGQDIVVAAFQRFVARHPDAVLVTAWHSPWRKVAVTLDKSELAEPVVLDEDGKVNVAAWAAANRIPAKNILDVGLVPNAMLPQLLREMDVAVFPNRGEGGTNLVAMEAMACGVPTILSRNTGHLDLVERDNCYLLEKQGECTGLGSPLGSVAGWGESDIDEVVEALERSYQNREEARARGLRGAETMAKLTWSRTAAEMKDVVFSCSA